MELVALAREIAAGEVTCAEVMERCLAQAREVEGWLRAFVWLDAERARRLAAEYDRRREAGERLGPLHGVPLGIKDIIDTAGIPTEHGSPVFAGRVPERSAEVVRRLEAVGAIVLGKAVTAEMAYFSPGPTRNPWDPERTPGGSSMGSAAAVAAEIVPGAVGTQTNGSVIRPAAFCGVVGFKPTRGRLPREGVLEFSQTLDQVGSFATSVRGAAWLAAAMAGDAPEAWVPAASAEASRQTSVGADRRSTGGGRDNGRRAPRFAVVPTAEWEKAEPAMQRQFEADVAALEAAGPTLERPVLPAGLDEAVPVHRTIMAAEAAAALGELVAAHPGRFSEVLQAFVEEGARLSAAAYQAALRERQRLVEAFTAWAAPYDAILTPPATGEAPGPETTGDPRFCTRWTLVGAPAIVLPTGLRAARLPLGLQMVGAPGADARLLSAATWVEARRRLEGSPRRHGDTKRHEERNRR